MQLVFATNNLHKLEEIQRIVGKQFQILNLNDIGFRGEIPETHETIEENASEKSHFIFERFKMNCFADDTGFEIDWLNGEPGVYSSRYAGLNATYDDNVQKVLEKMQHAENRNATFRTIISLILSGKEYFFEGKVNGKIIGEKKGVSGFGYDPIFVPEGYNKTFAELSPEEKNNISHRGKASAKLVAFLNSL